MRFLDAGTDGPAAFPVIPRAVGPLGDMPPEEFRAAGHALVDWIADYLEHPERVPRARAGGARRHRARLPVSAPEHGEAFDDIIADFERILVPGSRTGTTPASSPTSPSARARPASSPTSCRRRSTSRRCCGARRRRRPSSRRSRSAGCAQLIGLPDDVRGRHLRHGVDLDAARPRRGARGALPDVRRTGLAGRDDARGCASTARTRRTRRSTRPSSCWASATRRSRRIPSDERFRMRRLALCADGHRQQIARPACSHRRRRHRRHDVDDERRPGAGDRRRLRARRRLAARRRGLCRRRGDGAGRSGCSPAPSAPTRWS